MNMQASDVGRMGATAAGTMFVGLVKKWSTDNAKLPGEDDAATLTRWRGNAATVRQLRDLVAVGAAIETLAFRLPQPAAMSIRDNVRGLRDALRMVDEA
jgi:hypothetical protein